MSKEKCFLWAGSSYIYIYISVENVFFSMSLIAYLMTSITAAAPGLPVEPHYDQ